MLAGCSSDVVITPPPGALLIGPTAPSTGVHDDLCARALVLAEGDTQVAIVSLDLVGLDVRLAAEIRAQVRREIGVAAVLLNCSHTHSAPFTIPWSITGPAWVHGEGRPWRDSLPVKVAAAVRAARLNLQPAALAAGRAPVQVGMSRRLPTADGITMAPHPDGAVVPWVDVLRVDDLHGHPLAVLYSHACHPVIVHGASTLVSADFPAFAAQTIRQSLGDGVLPMFLQGCGASVNGEPLRGGFPAAARAGRHLGEAALRAAGDAITLPGDGLQTASARVELPLQDWPSRGECERGIAWLAERVSDADGDAWFLANVLLSLRALREQADGGAAGTLPLEINAIAVGEWCLLALQHEVVADYQLWAEGASPFPRTMTPGYTNGCESYIPTDADLAAGGYEAAHYSFPPGADAPKWGAGLLYPCRRPVRPGAEAQIKASMHSVWRALTA